MGRKDSLRRRPAKREPLRRFVIFSEGENTEPDYFRALERKYKRQALIALEIVPVGVPMTIAHRPPRERADEKARPKFLRGDGSGLGGV